MSGIPEDFSPQAKSRRWGTEQRLEFIEFRLFWDGTIRRSDLIDRFGISMQQASGDLALYEELAPGNAVYDRSLKRFMAGERFQPRLFIPNPDRYLVQLWALEGGIVEAGETHIGYRPDIATMPVPHRRVDGRILRTIVRAIRDKLTINVHYQSMNEKRPLPQWREVSPHAFSFDGLRWHVRAYCHLEDRFKDFVLSRFLNVGEIFPAEVRGTQDYDWRNFFDLVLIPNPALSPTQRQAVELDYNMTGGQLHLRIRRALLWYFNKRLRLDLIKEGAGAKEAPVVLLDYPGFQTAVTAAQGKRSPIEGT